MKNYPLEKYNFEFTEQPHRVVAFTHDAGEPIRAQATCCDSDTYDEKVGKELAAARCNFKVATRKLRRAINKIEEIELDLAAVRRSLQDAYQFRADAEEQYEAAYAELANLENSLK